MDVEFKGQSSTSPSRLSPLAVPFQPSKQQPFSQSSNLSKDNSQYVAPISLIDHFPDLDAESLGGFDQCDAQPCKGLVSVFPFDCEEYHQSEVSKCPDDWESVLVSTLGGNCTEELHSSVTSICTGQSSGFEDGTARWKQESIMDGEVSVCSKEKYDFGPVDQSLERKGTCVFDGSSAVEIPSKNLPINLPETYTRDYLFRSQVKVHVKPPASNLRQVKSIKGKSEDLSKTNDHLEVPNLGKLGNQRPIFTNSAALAGNVGSRSQSEMKMNESSYYNHVSTLKLPLQEEQSLALRGEGYETYELGIFEVDCLPYCKYDGNITSPDPFGSNVKKPHGPGIDTWSEDSFTMVNKDDMDENLTHVGFSRKTQNLLKPTSAVSCPPELQLPANITKACTGLNPQAPLFFPKHAERTSKYNESESTQDDSSYLQKSDAASANSGAPELACDIEEELSALGISCSDEMDEQKNRHHLREKTSSFSLFDLEESPWVLQGSLAPIENKETERELNRNLTDIVDADVNDGATVPVHSTEHTSRERLLEIEKSSLVKNPAVSEFSLADVTELVDNMHHLSELFVQKCPDTFPLTEPLLVKIHKIINNLATHMKNGDGLKPSFYDPLSNSLNVLNPSASTCEGMLSSKECEKYDRVFDAFSGSPTSTLESNIRMGPQIKEQIDDGCVPFPKLDVKVKLYKGKGKDTTGAKCSGNQTSSEGTDKKHFPHSPTALVEKLSDDNTVEKTQSFCGDQRSIMALQCHLEESPILHGKRVQMDQHGIDVKSGSLTLGDNDTCHNSNVDINTDLRGADIINPAEDSYIMVDKNELEENDIDVDSPCWKGLKNIMENPYGEFGPSDHEVPKRLPEARNSLNPQAPLFFPRYGDRSLKYEDHEGIGDVSPLKTVTPATAWSKELTILSNGENGLCCSEAHSSTGVCCSNDKPCNDHPLMDIKGSSLFSSELVQPSLKEGQLGFVPNIDVQIKANLDGHDEDIISTKFNNASSVSFQGLDGILAESLLAYGSSILIGSPSENGDRQSSSKSLKGTLFYSNKIAIKGPERGVSTCAGITGHICHFLLMNMRIALHATHWDMTLWLLACDFPCEQLPLGEEQR